MPRPLKLYQFLRHLDLKWFQELVKHLGIQATVPVPAKDQQPETVWFGFYSNLSDGDRKGLDDAFAQINEVATDYCIDSIREFNAEDGGSNNLIQELSKIVNPYNQAIYCFIHHYDLFDDVMHFCYFDSLATKREITNLKKVGIDEVKTKIAALEKELKGHFVFTEGRGHNCKVEHYVVNKENRISLVAYPEDFPKSDIAYNAKKDLEKSTRRSTFEIIFDYYASEGRLEVKVKGRRKEEPLIQIFKATVLGDDSPLQDREDIYDLDQLIAKDCTFPTTPTDDIKYVRVTEVVLVYRAGSWKIVLSHDAGANNQAIRQMVKDLNINPAMVKAIQAKIQIRFPGKGQRGSITAHLSLPDRSNLNDTVLHMKAKQYLKDWGIEKTE